jgi:hypothetical protein
MTVISRTEKVDASIEAIPIRRTATDLRLLLRSTMEMMNPQAKAMDVALNVVAQDGLPSAMLLDRDKLGPGFVWSFRLGP